MREPITEVWVISGGMAAANGLYDREEVAQAQHALNQSAGFKSASLERLPIATPEMVADAARWQWVRQFLSVEVDLSEGYREYLFVNDDRIAHNAHSTDYDNSVETLVDIARALSAARAAGGAHG